jgi:hypothetical protein
MISNISPKIIEKFTDPFKYDENDDLNEDGEDAAAAAEETKTNQ